MPWVITSLWSLAWGRNQESHWGVYSVPGLWPNQHSTSSSLHHFRLLSSSVSEEPNPKAMVAQLPSSSDLSCPLSDAYIHQQCWYHSLKCMRQPRAVTTISREKDLILRKRDLRVEHGEWGPGAPKWQPCGRGMNKDRSWERRYAPQTPLLGRGNAWSLALQSHAPQVPFVHLSVFFHVFVCLC